MFPSQRALRTWIEVSRSAFLSNFFNIAAHVQAPSIAVVVKAHAYGHGADIIARWCGDLPRVTMLCTAGIQEAIALRQAGWSRDILAMSYIDCPLAWCQEYGIGVVVTSGDHMYEVARQADREGIRLKVHLKIDTGMGRLGATVDSIEHIITCAPHCHALEVVGCMTHLSDTSGEDTQYTRHQLALFDQVLKQIRALWGSDIRGHAIASGAIDEHQHHDMVRIGSLLYGNTKNSLLYNRLRQTYPTFHIDQIMTWKTHIIHTKKIPHGSWVGYNRTYQAPAERIIGVLPVGYADGYPRQLSNRAQVYIGSYYAPVIGMVSMNMMTIDITHIPPDQWGGEVILSGPAQAVSFHTLAQQADMIANEFLACLPAHIPRVEVP